MYLQKIVPPAYGNVMRLCCGLSEGKIVGSPLCLDFFGKLGQSVDAGKFVPLLQCCGEGVDVLFVFQFCQFGGEFGIFLFDFFRQCGGGLFGFAHIRRFAKLPAVHCPIHGGNDQQGKINAFCRKRSQKFENDKHVCSPMCFKCAFELT